MQVEVIYHHEDGTWWAESPTLPGWSAAAPTFEDLRPLTREGVALAAEVDDTQLDLRESVEGSFAPTVLGVGAKLTFSCSAAAAEQLEPPVLFYDVNDWYHDIGQTPARA